MKRVPVNRVAMAAASVVVAAAVAAAAVVVQVVSAVAAIVGIVTNPDVSEPSFRLRK